MPFDGTSYPDLSVPSYVALSYALRHKETWPKGFTWNYRYCSGCALGLAVGLWPRNVKFAYSLPTSVYAEVRAPLRWYSAWVPTLNIRPEHVADALDTWIAKGQPR
jgi:hypothetical protein